MPAERYKTGAVHVVPLSSDLLALIEALPRFNSGPFLFSADWGKNPVRGLSKPKQRLDNRMEVALGTLEDGGVHDSQKKRASSAVSALTDRAARARTDHRPRAEGSA